jgi:hypothetical protein
MLDNASVLYDNERSFGTLFNVGVFKVQFADSLTGKKVTTTAASVNVADN